MAFTGLKLFQPQFYVVGLSTGLRWWWLSIVKESSETWSKDTQGRRHRQYVIQGSTQATQDQVSRDSFTILIHHQRGTAGFYCSIVNGKMQLRRSHSYYHLFDLQLFVAADHCEWCDFCIFTNCGGAVKSIYPDTSWQQANISRLQCYWYEHILPKLLDPKQKPCYYTCSPPVVFFLIFFKRLF